MRICYITEKSASQILDKVAHLNLDYFTPQHTMVDIMNRFLVACLAVLNLLS